MEILNIVEALLHQLRQNHPGLLVGLFEHPTGVLGISGSSFPSHAAAVVLKKPSLGHVLVCQFMNLAGQFRCLLLDSFIFRVNFESAQVLFGALGCLIQANALSFQLAQRPGDQLGNTRLRGLLVNFQQRFLLAQQLPLASILPAESK